MLTACLPIIELSSHALMLLVLWATVLLVGFVSLEQHLPSERLTQTIPAACSSACIQAAAALTLLQHLLLVVLRICQQVHAHSHL